MKAKRMLALLLAALTVITAVVIPTAAETVASGTTVTYSFTSTMDSEVEYLEAGTSVAEDNGKFSWNGRFADGERTFGYSFPIKADAVPEAVTFRARMRGNILIEISLDKAKWVTVYERTDSVNPTSVSLDLTDAVAELWGTETPDYLCFRLSDPTTKDGNGVNVMCYEANGSRAVTSLTMEYPEGTEFYTKHVTLHSFTPSKDYSTETAYHHKALSTASSNDFCHYADKENQLVYAFEMLTTELPATMELSFKTAQQLKLSISVDNRNWVDVYECPADLYNPGSDGGLAAQVMTFDLLDYYKKALETDELGSTMLYIRIGDADTTGGWGGCVYYDTPFSLRMEYAPYTDGLEMIDFTSTINGTSEDAYYLSGGSVSGTARFADRDAWVVFQYPVTGAGSSERILLTMKPTQQFRLEVSVDGINWVGAFRYVDTGLMQTLAGQTNQNGFFFASRERTFDLTEAVHEAARISAEQGTSDAGLYFRYGDAHPVRVDADGRWMTNTEDGYNAGAGWGGSATGNVKLSMATTDSLGSIVETNRDVVSKVEISGIDPKKDTYTYRFIEDEPMLVTSYGLPQGALSTNIGAGTVDVGEDETYTSRGDGNWNGRAADNINAFFIYRYQIPATANSMIWSATVGGAYGVDVAIDGEVFPNPYDSTLWTNVALYSDDGLDGKNQSISKVISYDLTGKGTETGDKYIYLKFYDADLDLSGYGARVALGSNYPVTMSWGVSLAEDAAYAGIESVALNLTENFNLIYKLNIPLSSQETKVEVGLEGGTMTELTAREDGTYRFEDILPQQMGDTVKLRLSGMAGGILPYSYEAEYSVKQYCENMMTRMADDEVFVTLLKDILYYGAAAQRYVSYKTDALVDAELPVRDSTALPLLGGVYDGTPEGTQLGDAAWYSAALELNNTTAIVYKFTASDVSDLKIRVMTNRGIETVYDAESFTATGMTAEDGTPIWQLTVPVMAHEFTTAHIATFIEGEAEYKNYRLIYSINTYISKQYNEAEAKLQDILGALGNYGVSVTEYLVDQASR